MGILDSLERSKDDNIKPKRKSYWGFVLDIQLVDHRKVANKIHLLPTERRLVAHELSGREPVEEVIVLRNSKKSLGRLTTNQIRDILDDIGFNVDPLFSGSHFADFEAVMNVNGYAVPGWVKFARIMSRLFPSKEKLLLLKLSPGQDRLHIRVFEMNDGSWMIISHTDFNWMNLNIPKVYRAHINSGLPKGSGDYITGTIMMQALLKKFSEHLTKNELLPYSEVESISRWAYGESISKKLGRVLNIYGSGVA